MARFVATKYVKTVRCVFQQFFIFILFLDMSLYVVLYVVEANKRKLNRAQFYV